MWTVELSTLKLYCPDGIHISTLKSADIPTGCYTHNLCIDDETLGKFCLPLIQMGGDKQERYFWHDGSTKHHGLVSVETLRRQYYLSADHLLNIVDVKNE